MGLAWIGKPFWKKVMDGGVDRASEPDLKLNSCSDVGLWAK